MKRVGDLLQVIFDEKMMEKADGYSSVFSCWKDLTEKNGIPAAAAHSWVKTLDNGIVWIEVDHPGWKQILQTKEGKLLHDFRYRFPKMGISAISITLCRPGAGIAQKPADGFSAAETPPAYDAGHPAGYPATPADDDAGGPEYDGIKSEALRKLLMRLEKSIAEREGRG